MEEVRVAAIVDLFTLGSAAQQLIDRLLAGYPFRGDFVRPRLRLGRIFSGGSERSDPAAFAAAEGHLAARRERFGLEVTRSLDETWRGATGVLVVRPRPWDEAQGGMVLDVVERAPRSSRVFVWGALGADLEAARRCQAAAQERGVALSAGTYLPATWRLPAVDVAAKSALRRALVVVVGEESEAFALGVEALAAFVERRAGGEAGVVKIERLDGRHVWKALDDGGWTSSLLAAAVSRSDSICGDPERDGRTQDAVGLGLLQQLVPEPRAWFLEHADGLRSAVVLLNGALRDFHFAVEDAAGAVVSAQLYRGLRPNEEHYSRLARLVEEFVLSGEPPHPPGRDLQIAALLGAARGAGAPDRAPPYSAFEVSEFGRVEG
jgi:hypothetical protein